MEENATLGNSYAQSEHSNRQKETWALQMEMGAVSIRPCAGYATKILIINYKGILMQVGMVQIAISSEAAWASANSFGCTNGTSDSGAGDKTELYA